jgi:hypothetical protein
MIHDDFKKAGEIAFKIENRTLSNNEIKKRIQDVKNPLLYYFKPFYFVYFGLSTRFGPNAGR